MPITLDDQETAIVLASLRMVQRLGVHSQEEDVATNGGKFDFLGDDAIDELCERINCDGPATPPAFDDSERCTVAGLFDARIQQASGCNDSVTADRISELSKRVALALAAPSGSLAALLQSAVDAWPQCDPTSQRHDEEINGGDAVEWLGGFIEQAKAALAAAPTPILGRVLDMLKRMTDQYADTIDVHIYNKGDTIEPDCQHHAIVKEARDVIAAAEAGGIPAAPSQIFVAIFEGRIGDEIRTYPNRAGAEAWRQEIAAENWDSMMNSDKPDDPAEAAEEYFDAIAERGRGFFRIEESTLQPATTN